MGRLEKIIEQMRNEPRNVRFSALKFVCEAYFGAPRQSGTSHAVFKTPWPGDPRVNIQGDKGMAKVYQVKQVLAALDALAQWEGKKLNADHYTYRITWSQEDQEYVGLCAEFPSLSWLARTPQAALTGISRVVEEVVADMLTQGEDIPEAIADRTYSGKFAVRIPPEQHRRLAIEAREQGVSLNRLVAAKLAA